MSFRFVVSTRSRRSHAARRRVAVARRKAVQLNEEYIAVLKTAINHQELFSFEGLNFEELSEARAR